MSIKIDAASAKVAYHVEDGAVNFPYAVDAHSAVSRFPNEWSFTPWSKDGGSNRTRRRDSPATGRIRARHRGSRSRSRSPANPARA
jgi:hypothetical protein